MRKLLCLLLVLVMLPVSAAFADQPVSWLYAVTPGEALSGDGLQPLLDVLNTVQLELTSQKNGDTLLGSAVFLSKGPATPYKAFSLNGQLIESGILSNSVFTAKKLPVILMLNDGRSLYLKD